MKRGTEHGATDDFAYNITDAPAEARDLHATILHLVGIDHTRLVARHRGLDQKLTGVEPARVVTQMLEQGGAEPG